ncbi:MAG: DUF1491 family protein [Hyphomicrobiales bacterium]|nr:DUF1491 family protein [Hyphomicrobiales bacterium]
MRLRSDIFVAALLRQAALLGLAAALVRRGAEAAGAIFIEIDHLDGTVSMFGPAPPDPEDTALEGRAFAQLGAHPRVEAAAARDMMARQTRYDPDLWHVAIEDRSGTQFTALPGFAAVRDQKPG